MIDHKKILPRLLKKTSLFWAGTALAIIAATFTAGVYVAQYKIFPYALVRNLKNSLWEAYPGLFPQTPETIIPETILTHLYALDTKLIPLEEFTGTGGAIESLSSGDLLIATPHGRIARIAPNGEVSYLNQKIPMNKSGLEAYIREHPEFIIGINGFRVADILLKEHSPESFQLFASHHYFDGKGVRFRLSSAILHREEEGAIILSQWETLFDAQPLSLNFRQSGNQAGGKMLMDGNEHLLIIIGDHGKDGWEGIREMPNLVDNPDFHLGKLIRIEISTGRAETLTSGHRCPQGLVRDRNGRLWATENGPQGGDELNLLKWGGGGHYGWPHVSYGIRYGGGIPNTIAKNLAGQHEGFQRPAFAWVTAIAPAGIVVNEARWFPLWKDDFLIAALRGKSIYRCRLHNDQVQYVERIKIGKRLRDIEWMPDGRIALLGDKSEVLFLSRSTKYCTDEYRKMRHVYAADCDSYEK